MAEPARAPLGDGARSVTVKVGGTEYRLRTGQEEALAQEAASLVSGELERLRKGRNPPVGQEALILAALNLAGELLQERHDAQRQREDLAKRLDTLLKKLEERL